MILIHRPGGQGRSTLGDDLKPRLPEDSGAFFWQTCLRQIALVDEPYLEQLRPALLRGDEIYHADVAYRFLLEVICGLHSPLIGETEVYGQFKNAASLHPLPSVLWGTRLKKFFRVLFEDAKRIRQSHLEDLGSQTYGSVLRRDLRGMSEVQIIGAGQLVKDLLPWVLADGVQVTVHARNLQKARENLAMPLGFEPLVPFPACRGAIIIAAPLSAHDLIRLVRTDQNTPSLIVDLRADSHTDRFVLGGAKTIDLKEVFARLEANQALLAERKDQALRAIQMAAHERTVAVENRPFGWEDVCA